MNYNLNRIRNYEVFIRDTVNEIVDNINYEKLEKENKTFLTKIKERLCFDNDKGWKFLTSSLDTIGDSHFAISTFIEKNRNNDTGENYLRIYGVLSAVYIQQQALIKLSDLIKLDKLNSIKKEIKSLKITFLRNCISAHPVNFNNNSELISFKIDRNSVNQKGTLSVIDENNNSENYNIFECLITYLKIAEIYLEKICYKLVKNAFKTSEPKIKILEFQIQKIKSD